MPRKNDALYRTWFAGCAELVSFDVCHEACFVYVACFMCFVPVARFFHVPCLFLGGIFSSLLFLLR